MTRAAEPSVRKITDFLNDIGIPVSARALGEHTFLPGIEVEAGRLLYDAGKLKYPGDLLHEAGHLAVLPPEQRAQAGNDFAEGGEELAAIAWSYAACLHLGLPLEVLFHADGYKGDAAWLIETFSGGNYIGLPLLVWKGMTDADGAEAYPSMRRWLCP